MNLDTTPYSGIAFDIISEVGSITGSLQLYTDSVANSTGVSFGGIVPGETKIIPFSSFSFNAGVPNLADVDRIQIIFAVETSEEFTISNLRFIPEPTTGAMLLCSLAMVLGHRRRS